MTDPKSRAPGTDPTTRVGRPEQDSAEPKSSNTLQTLDRGLQALALISQQADGLSISNLAARLDVHKAIAYRLVTTLEGHGLIGRGGDGRLHLGAGLMTLAARFAPQLRTIAQPLLRSLADTTQAAAFLSVPQGEECVAIMVAEPEGKVLSITYRVGSRHPLFLGAAGIAILAGRPEGPDDTEPVRQARRDGFSVTRSQIQKGAVGVASAVHHPGRDPFPLEASVGVVALDDLDTVLAADAVVAHARRIADLLG